MMVQPRIAVLLPCFNEEAAIAEVIAGFRKALPGAAIYVYDNNSRDRTAEKAKKAGAIVRTERQQGKGHVVRRMFADVDADIYVMADGDLTYDPKAAPAMVEQLLADELDMVVGTRQHEAKDAYRGGHVLVARSVAVLQVDRDRKLGGPVQRADMPHHIGQRGPAVGPPQREREAGTGAGREACGRRGLWRRHRDGTSPVLRESKL